MKDTKIILILSITLIFIACEKKEIQEFSGPTGEELDNINLDTDLPIVKEEIDIDFFAGRSSKYSYDWNELMIWEEYSEMTRMNVNWETAPPESIEHERMFKLGAGDEMPNAFYATSIPTTDLLTYGEQGVFIPLNSLIEEYAPNISGVLTENPDIEKAITHPDGNIYSIPTIIDPDFIFM